MPIFLEKTWTDTRPSSAKGSGIAEAIKEWNKHCPDSFETFSDAKLMKAATDTADSFLAAIKKAEGKIIADKSKDDKTLDKINKTKLLLSKWRADIVKYKEHISIWSQNYIKEQGAAIRGNEKILKEAQMLFDSLLVVSLENALDKMPVAKKEFETAIQNRTGEVAGAKLDVYRKRLQEGKKLVGAQAVTQQRQIVLARYEGIAARDLPEPAGYAEAKRKFLQLENAEGVMQDQLEKLADELASEDAPITGKPDEAYKKAVGEALAGYKRITEEVKKRVPQAAKALDTAKKIVANPGLPDPKTSVSYCQRFNEALFKVQQEVMNYLALTRNTSSPLRAKVKSAGLTDEDDKKVLLPQMNAAYAANKHFLALVAQAKELIGDYLEDLAGTHPDSGAAAELSNMAGKYKIS